MKLRDYEADWVRRIKESKSKRILIVGPTGCGKTVVAVSLLRSAVQQGKRVLFLAHRKELISQARQRLIEHGVSPASVGIIRSTEPENRSAKIQVASVQTLVRRKMPPADVVFIDEAHHAASATYLKILRHYPKARVFGLTATPYRLDGKPLGKLFDEIVESVKPSKLIESGWINRPRVWTVPPEERANLEGVKTTAGDFNVGQLGAVSNKKSLVGSIVDHWKRLAEGLPTVCYAVSVAHAEHIAKSFRRAKVKAAVLSGETPGDKRAELLRMLKDGELQVLVNCMVLTEGWDCPEARCAIVARATMSQTLWFQMCGRIMRPGERPPIVLDHAGNALWLPLPGEDIDFSLETALRKKGPVRGAKEKACPECGNRLFLGCRVCPNCGFEFWTGEPPEEVAGELREAVRNDEEICEAYEKGESACSISRRLGCNKKTIFNLLKQNNIRIRPIGEARIGFSINHQEVVKDYSKGESAASVAEKHGCSDATIVRILNRNGVKLRPSSPMRDDLDNPAISKAYRKGESLTQLAKIYRCSERTIRSHLQSNGLEIRTLSEACRCRGVSTK